QPDRRGDSIRRGAGTGLHAFDVRVGLGAGLHRHRPRLGAGRPHDPEESGDHRWQRHATHGRSLPYRVRRSFVVADRRMRLVPALTLLALTLLGACKGDAQKCDTGCRNFATLRYWKAADAEVAAAPADQRDALRKQKLGEFDQKLESGIDM